MQTLWMWTVDCSEMREKHEGNPTVLTGGADALEQTSPRQSTTALKLCPSSRWTCELVCSVLLYIPEGKL
jgi:hypothetical protein